MIHPPITLENPLKKLREHFRVSDIAAFLGCSPQAVSQWDLIPVERSKDIEIFTSGMITAVDVVDYAHYFDRHAEALKQQPTPATAQA